MLPSLLNVKRPFASGHFPNKKHRLFRRRFCHVRCPENISFMLLEGHFSALSFLQGRYDVCCPMMSAWDLHKAWPEAELIVCDYFFSAFWLFTYPSFFLSPFKESIMEYMVSKWWEWNNFLLSLLRIWNMTIIHPSYRPKIW